MVHPSFQQFLVFQLEAFFQVRREAVTSHLGMCKVLLDIWSPSHDPPTASRESRLQARGRGPKWVNILEGIVKTSNQEGERASAAALLATLQAGKSKYSVN